MQRLLEYQTVQDAVLLSSVPMSLIQLHQNQVQKKLLCDQQNVSLDVQKPSLGEF